MLPDLMNRRKWGAQRSEEGLREYVHGLLAWKLIAGESLEYGEDEVHKLVTGGFVIPLVVMAQPELSEAVIPIELELGHGRLSGKDLLVTMLSLTPAPTRLAPQTELDSAARRALSNERLIYRMADNILQLLRYGIMWHKSSWHPQNFYAVLEKSTGKEPPAMLMADAGDMLFFWDYFTQEHQGEIAEDELMVIMLAEALHNIRFMPLLDKSEKPQGATFKFYEHLLGRDLTPEEKKYCGLQVGERDVLDNYVGISKNMARQILERVYDQKRWEYGRGLRDKLAGGYGLEVELDDAADFRARVEKWF
jgi:hypothetical protein